jgi:hypothetical protein
MSTKRKPTVDDLYDQRQRGSNAPESEAVTLDDTTIFEAARQAVVLLKKTFETWVVIGKAVVRARDIADRRGGGKTFMRLVEQQGLSRVVNKTTASTLLRIMERLPEVTKWHETLTDRQQIDWAAPTTVLKRCPVFAKPKPNEPKPLTKGEQDRQALAAALEENAKLKRREDGDRFKPTDSADDIATVLVGMFSASKAREIAKRITEKLVKRGMH